MKNTQLLLTGYGVLELAGIHVLFGLMDDHALTRRDDLVKLARVAANSIKVLLVSKEIVFVLGDRDPHCHNYIY